MATYKVIQDIEAEDKIIGPLTLRQFIFAFIDLILIFVAVRLITVQPILALIFLPFIVGLTVLALPLGRDQPTEVWLLAKMRFYLKPHKRIWNQTGASQLVTINAPRHEDHIYNNGLSKTEVRSRLSALANTLDSRGWAVKNVNVNLYNHADYSAGDEPSDRLIGLDTLPQQVPTIVVAAEDDIMDEVNNPLARQMDTMVREQTDTHYEQVAARTRLAAQSSSGAVVPDYTFIEATPLTGQPTPPSGMTQFVGATVQPGSDSPAAVDPSPLTTAAEEDALLRRLHEQQEREKSVSYSGHLKRIMTPQEVAEEERKQAQKEAELQAQKTKEAAATKPPNPVTIDLAKNSDDLKVSTVASLANHKAADNSEVVISLR